MPDIKISDMTDAGNGTESDIIPLVREADNYQTTRSKFLTANEGESVGLRGPSSAIQINTADGIEIFVATGMTLSISWGGTPIIILDGSGKIFFNGNPGFALTINNNGSEIKIDDGGTIWISQGDGNTPKINYGPGNPSDWVTPPTLIHDALDHLATAVRALLGAPIP